MEKKNLITITGRLPSESDHPPHHSYRILSAISRNRIEMPFSIFYFWLTVQTPLSFQNISILVVLLYSWRISVNVKRYSDLEEVYYGMYAPHSLTCARICYSLFWTTKPTNCQTTVTQANLITVIPSQSFFFFPLLLSIHVQTVALPGVQIAYFAIIGTQCSMVLLSIVLIFGIYKVSIVPL